MLLQLALDAPFKRSLDILHQVRPFIDIAEIGTPQIFQNGVGIAAQYLQDFPDLDLLADLKIMDAGKFEAQIAFQAGCKYITALGVASDQTILGALEEANKYDGCLIVDMIEVENLIERCKQLLKLGADYFCLHTAYDRQQSEKAPTDSLKIIRQAFPKVKLAIAGGIGLDTIDEIVELQPDIIVVGGAITTAANPVEIAQKIRQRF